MGRIDKRGCQDRVMERRHIELMLRNIDEYESVKRGNHQKYEYAKDFYIARGLCKQNFLKYYRRYINAGREIKSLIPHKTGRKFKTILEEKPEILEKIKDIRSKGFNRYDISERLKERHNIDISSSGIYRLLVKLKLNKLNPKIKEEVRRIIKVSCGELGHIDIHYVAKDTVKELGNKKLYILGIIDSYSRVCWLDVITNIKALNVSMSMLDMLTLMRSRYGIEFKEMMSDNGSEFASRNNKENHPVERLMSLLEIKHRYTKPATPKTNGKIERFWRTLEDELLSGESFDTLDEFKHYIKGYCLYYNEHRSHQGIGLKKPLELV